MIPRIHNLSPSLILKRHPRILRDLSTALRSHFVLIHSGRIFGFRNLACGQLGQRRKNQLRFTYVITKILTLESF